MAFSKRVPLARWQWLNPTPISSMLAWVNTRRVAWCRPTAMVFINRRTQDGLGRRWGLTQPGTSAASALTQKILTWFTLPPKALFTARIPNGVFINQRTAVRLGRRRFISTKTPRALIWVWTWPTHVYYMPQCGITAAPRGKSKAGAKALGFINQWTVEIRGRALKRACQRRWARWVFPFRASIRNTFMRSLNRIQKRKKADFLPLLTAESLGLTSVKTIGWCNGLGITPKLFPTQPTKTRFMCWTHLS